MHFRIIKDVSNKYIYIVNNDIVKKDYFIYHLRFLIKRNNELFYQFKDFKKAYHNGYMLLSYKDALKDMKNNGMIYSFYVSLGIKK